MANQEVGLTKTGKIVVAVVAVGLVIGGIALMSKKAPEGASETPKTVDLAAAKNQLSGTGLPVAPPAPVAPTPPGPNAEPEKPKAEAMDPKGITTFEKYDYVPASRLPEVKGTSGYAWDESNKVVTFPINVWIGWLPIVAANGGFAPNENSVFFKKYGFKVELKLIDDPVAARDAYASGASHVLWGTLDMIALFADSLSKDSRTAPRVVQQIDWSNGGDGIVVRDAIKTVEDLKGKTVTLAQNSPSQYYLNALLIASGVQPAEVTFKYTQDAFQAATAFVSDPAIDACVSWAPDIYKITEKVPGTRLLSTTADASKLLADVWAVRADFAKDHPDVVKGLAAGIFEGMDIVKKDPTEAITWLADGYKMTPDDVKGMMLDAHSTNFGENREFFLNKQNPTNFERTWKNINFVYQSIGVIDSPRAFDEVMDFSVIDALDKEGTFKHQTDQYVATFAPTSYEKVQAEKPLVRQSLRINFYPNSSNLYDLARDELGIVIAGRLYDPNVTATIDRGGLLAGQFSTAIIAITGHTDASMKNTGLPAEAVAMLSEERARAVMQALIDKYKFPKEKFVVKGLGWDKPADPSDPNNHALNRRVEVSVFPAEAVP
jgi:NitT/TauT family transport system substrate-binding protein